MGDVTNYCSVEVRRPNARKKVVDRYVPLSGDSRVANNIYLYGIRGEGRSAVRRAAALMAQDRFDASLIHTHTFPLSELPTGLRYAREKIDGAIKVVIKNQE